MIIFNNNKNIINECEEIISFLLKILGHIIFNPNKSIELIEWVKEIIAIFRKLASYNLINNKLMISICINILKTFDYIRIIRNSFSNNYSNFKNSINIKSDCDIIRFDSILLKLYYIIIKIMLNFIYNYNDNILNKIIFNEKKYSDIDTIDIDNFNFLFKKNELGKFISKINIYILSYIQKHYNNSDNKKIVLIQRIGMEILKYFLNKDDDYILNIISSINQLKYSFIDLKKL